MDNHYAASNAPMKEPPLREQRGGKRLPFSGWWPVGFGAFAGLLLRLVYMGLPGEPYSAMLGSFIMGSPILVGAVTVYLAELEERRTWGYYFVAPVVATGHQQSLAGQDLLVPPHHALEVRRSGLGQSDVEEYPLSHDPAR